MPIRATLAGSIAVMSTPSRTMRPVVGFRNLVNKLNTVLLPAPLGPINAWIRPWQTSMSTSLTARNGPKRLVSPRADRTARGAPASTEAAAGWVIMVKGSLLDVWAGAVFKRRECLVARNGSENLVEVAFGRRLRRLLHAYEEHVVDDATVFTQVGVAVEEVVDVDAAHGFHDLRAALDLPGRFSGLQVVHDGRVDTGMNHGRLLAFHTLAIACRPFTGLVIHVPIEGIGQREVLRDVEAYTLNICEEQQHTSDLLAGIGDTELLHLLQGRHGVAG